MVIGLKKLRVGDKKFKEEWQEVKKNGGGGMVGS